MSAIPQSCDPYVGHGPGTDDPTGQGQKLRLEQKLGVPVDVTTRDSLHPLLRADIEQSAVRVF
jgi:hypothetical protein